MVKIAKFLTKRTFGLELEFGNNIDGESLRNAIRSVDKEREIKLTEHYVKDDDNNYWHVKLDHSCGDEEGEYGYEVASFKASGINDVLLMGLVVDAIKMAGANINKRCALHLHVGVPDFTVNQLAVLAARWIKIEPFICHIVPSYRAKNIYCKFFRHEKWVNEVVAADEKLTEDIIWSKIKPKNDNNLNRRHSLNFCNFFHRKERKTVEFRFPEGTVSSEDVKNWIKLFVIFVENCLTSKMPSDLSVYNFFDFLEVCGLHGKDDFLLLSSGIRDVKIWLLKRVIQFSRSSDFSIRASNYLEKMV